MPKRLANSNDAVATWTRLRVSWVICFWLLIVGHSTSSFGQDPVTLATATQLADLDSYSDTERLIVSTLRESNPGTATELIEAIRILLEIEATNDAKFYLEKLKGLSLNDQAMFDVVDAVGSDFFFGIHRMTELQPDGRAVAKTFLTASRKIALAPDRIDALMQQLNHPNISIRSEAFRKLKRLGEPAVAALISAFAEDSKIKLFPGIRGALQHMGESLQDPMLAGARSNDLQVQVECIRALKSCNSSESLDVMMRAFLSAEAPESTRRIAREYLEQHGALIDPVVIEQRLYDRALNFLQGKQSVRGGILGMIDYWQWDTNTKKIVSQKVPIETANRIIASQRAVDVYEIRPDLGRNRELFVLAQLEAAKRLAGPEKRIDANAWVQKLELKAFNVDRYLSRSLELDLVPAAVACCEILKEIGSVDLLYSGTTRPCSLVRAILAGDRHLQFAAMDAIVSVDPKQDFLGSSYLVSLAVYLAQSDNLPTGLIGHVRPEVAQSYAANFSAAGYVGLSVNNSRDLFKIATSNPDLEVLVLTDTLTRPGFAELIQELRNDWRTRRLPIALLYRNPVQERRGEILIGDDPRFVAIPFASDPFHVAAHVRQLKSFSGPWEVSNYSRRRHAAKALQWLAKISTDRKSYRFINLGAYEEKLARLLYVPGFAGDACQILSRLGTPLCQRELVNFASQSANPIGERKQVVSAFVDSIARGGTLLTTQEIQRQYDRYNSSEKETPETQKILAAILDAIESRKTIAN